MLPPILKYKVRQSLNTIKHGSIQKKLEWLLPLFIIPYYITLIHGMNQIYENVYQAVGWEGLTKLATSNMAMIFFFVLVSSISIALYRLFHSKDLNLLMSLPVHDKPLFNAKFSELFGDTLRNMILPFPIFVALALVINKVFSFLQLIIFIIGLIFILIQITGVSMIIGLLLGKVTAKGKWSVISRIIAVVSALILLAIFMIYIQQKDDAKPLSYSIRYFDRIIFFFPTSWLIKSVSYDEDIISSLINGFAFFLLTIVSVLFSFILFKLRFKRTWMEIIEVSPRKKAQRARKVIHRGKIRSLLSKDFQTLYREPNLLISLIVPLVLYPIFIVFKDQDIRMHIFYIVLVSMVGTTSYTLSCIGREGRAFAMLRSLPIRISDILYSKFILSLVLNLLITLLFVILMNLIQRSNQFLYNSILGIIVSLSLTIMGIGIASLFPKFDFTNPMKAVLLPGVFVFYLMSIFFGITLTYVIFTKVYFLLMLVAWLLLALVIVKFGKVKLERMDL